MGQSRDTFHWADYLVFSLVLATSSAVGIYQARAGGKNKTQGEYFLGDRQMSAFPVGMSLAASFISAITILGAPAEIYMYGTQYFMTYFGIAIACLISATCYVPLLHPLNVISVNEYHEMRFNSRAVRLVGTFLTVVATLIYMGTATYSPATALEAVTGFPVWGSVLCVGIVTTVYSTLGGMKGVIWTDAFQTVVMLGGLVAIVVMGSLEVGGIDQVWEINSNWSRIEFFNFDPDPRTRHSFWTLIFATAVSWSSTYGISQTSVQRYCSLPSVKKARLALVVNVIILCFLFALPCLAGIVVFAYFASQGCDPISNGDINNPNQILPYFMMQVLAYPGIPGVFVATLFAGALSSMSSGINTMAACTWEDILKPYLGHLPESRKTLITKGLVCVYGVCGTGMAFAAQQMGGTVLQASLSFVLSAASPGIGMFLLGGLFPYTNWIGVVAGALSGLAASMWVSIGAYSTTLPSVTLDVPTAGCLNYTAPSETPPIEVTGVAVFYSMSYVLYPVVGVITTLVIGIIVSLLTGPEDPNNVDKKLMIPLFDRICCCFPEKWRALCRCSGDIEGRSVYHVNEDVSMTNKGYNDDDLGKYSSTKDKQ